MFLFLSMGVNKRSGSEEYNPMLKKRNISIREVGLR
jgi:hypothetical protein